MFSLAGAFMSFLRSQPLAARRSYLHDHVSAFLENPDHPDLLAIREALPADVRDALDLLIDVARRSNWKGR